jgi:uncharacterized FAD-dependent dehydrogenase
MEDGKVASVTVNGEIKIDCEVLILAIGHSARDTVEMLHRKSTALTPKAFAVGFRIEHRQDMIDEAQYGKFPSGRGWRNPPGLRLQCPLGL